MVQAARRVQAETLGLKGAMDVAADRNSGSALIYKQSYCWHGMDQQTVRLHSREENAAPLERP